MAKKQEEKLKIEIIKPVAGKFKLSYDWGKVYSIDKKQAEILIDSGYAKQVK